jgi:hypothetical protein
MLVFRLDRRAGSSAQSGDFEIRLNRATQSGKKTAKKAVIQIIFLI